MIRCSKCGTLNEADTSFCTECNSYLEWSGEKTEGEAETTPAGAPPPPAAMPARPGPPAPPPEEQPESRQPSRADTSPKPRVKPATAPAAKTDKPKPGDRLCPECGTGNDPQRKFCRRCGHSLTAAPLAAPPPAPPKTPWYRRGRGQSQEPQAYDAGQRPGGQGARRWRPGCVSMVIAILLVLGLGGALSYLYVPSVSSVVNDVFRTVRNRVEGVTVVNPATTNGPSAGGHPAAHASDGDPETFWLGVPGSQERWRLKMRFERPVDLRQVDIQPGASGDEYREHGRPRLIVFRAGEEVSDRYELADDGEKQTVTIDFDDTSEVWLVVLETFGGTEAEDDVAIREVVFGMAK